MKASVTASLLCVCNYPSNTGFAWDFIESIYAGLAVRMASHRIRTFVAYPSLLEPPQPLRGSPAIPVQLDATLRTTESIRRTLDFVRLHSVRVCYLTDRPFWSPAYGILRTAGVRRVLVHDHSSGERSRPRGLRWAAKWGLARLPWIVADIVVAVSDYVARRDIETSLLPPRKVVRVWNGMSIPAGPSPGEHPLHEALGLPIDRPIVACACRAATEKGVPVLLRAFDKVAQRWPQDRPRPLLVYMGFGPQFAEVERTRDEVASRSDIILAGYRSDAVPLLAGASVCAMPSLWQDALPLAVSQPLSLGRPVVASAVGGIPEMIVDGVTGLLVPPGDELALACALERVLVDPGLARRLGDAGRARMSELFTPDAQQDALEELVLAGIGRH